MSKTVSCRLSSDEHGKLLDKCNEKGLTVNDFVKVLVHTALDGTEKLAFPSKTKSLNSHEKVIDVSDLEKPEIIVEEIPDPVSALLRQIGRERMGIE